MTLAERLRRVLDARGCTPSEAARLAGMPRQQVHKLVSGENHDPKLSTVERIVEAIGSSMGEFYEDGEGG